MKRRARRTNDPLAGISNNSARGRRISDLVRSHLRALNDPSDINVQAACVACAELQVLAEEARAAALAQAGAGDLDQVVRVQRLANAALHRLGLDRIKPRDDKPTPSLDQYLTSKREVQP
jgi:hypothetical protein